MPGLTKLDAMEHVRAAEDALNRADVRPPLAYTYHEWHMECFARAAAHAAVASAIEAIEANSRYDLRIEADPR